MLRLSLSILFVVMLALPAVAADADKAKAPTIIILDMQRVLQESLAAKSAQKQLETQRSKFQTEIEEEENGLRKAEKDLVQSRNTVPADVYADKEQQLRQRFLVVERQVQGRRKVLDQAFTDSMNVVRSNLSDIVQAVAKERAADLVLVKQQVLWADSALDVTDEVLRRLNEKLPEISVKIAPEQKPEVVKP